MVKQINNIGENYDQNLKTLTDINKRIKFQAKDYYDRYYEIKKQFKKDRKDLKAKVNMLEYEQKYNVEENSKNKMLYKDLNNDMDYFKKKMGIKDQNANQGKEK